MSDYDAIIIGAGVGGLTAGSLLSKHGKKVLIVEQHSIPGGYCTSYKRKGFVFDVPCIIGGMRKGDPIQQLLEYINVYDKVEFIEIPKLAKIIGPDIEIDWHMDTYKLEQEFISRFPKERTNLQRFFRETRLIWDEICRAHYKAKWWQMMSYPLLFPRLMKYEKYTVSQFLDRFFTNEKLKDLLGKESVTLALSRHELSLLIYLGYIMGYASGGIFYPKGGFQVLSDAMADSFQGYGGELRLRTKVSSIIIKNKRAVGIELEDGGEITADTIISNADTKQTYMQMIGKENMPSGLYKRINASSDSFSGVVVKLAVKKEFPEWEDYAWIFRFKEYDAVSKMLAKALEGEIDLDHFCFSIDTSTLLDKETNESGISVINLTMLPISYKYQKEWQKNDKAAYTELKEKIADVLIRAAQELIPDLPELIVAKDITTPHTFERYTSAAQGGWYDLALTPLQSCNYRIGPKTPIKGFYTTGGKSAPGPGLNAAIPAGLYTADTLLNGKLTKGLSYIDPALLQ